jgi:hypothetical protein
MHRLRILADGAACQFVNAATTGLTLRSCNANVVESGAILDYRGVEMKLRLTATVAVLSLLGNFAAQAATLNPIDGTIFTRTGGQGFHRVTSSTEVQPGDTVMAALDSSAQIVLNDGTVITVTAGQVVTVPGSERRAEGIDPAYALIGVGAAAGIGVGIYYAIKKSNTPAPIPASP